MRNAVYRVFNARLFQENELDGDGNDDDDDGTTATAGIESATVLETVVEEEDDNGFLMHRSTDGSVNVGAAPQSSLLPLGSAVVPVRYDYDLKSVNQPNESTTFRRLSISNARARRSVGIDKTFLSCFHSKRFARRVFSHQIERYLQEYRTRGIQNSRYVIRARARLRLSFCCSSLIGWLGG